MKKVILKLYDISLAEISDNGGELFIKDDSQNVIKAQKTYPINMREYRPGLSGFVLPLEVFFNAFNRSDIKKEANILQTDSVFDKLFKVAGLDIEPINGFYIVQG